MVAYNSNNNLTSTPAQTPADSPSSTTGNNNTSVSQQIYSINANDANQGLINVSLAEADEIGNANLFIADKEIYEVDDSIQIEKIDSKVLEKTFGRPDDYLELHIYNSSNQKIHTEDNFTDFEIPEGQDCAPLTKFIRVNPEKILKDRGYITGIFRLKINIFKNKIFNTNQFPFNIKEISSDRREIRSITPTATNAIFDPAVSEFLSDLESSLYFKEFSINLGNDKLIPCINALLNKGPYKHELILKTYQPLSRDINNALSFKIVEEIVDPLFIEVNLGAPELVENIIPLRGPNFHIDVRQHNSIPTDLKNYDDLLNYNLTSSYQHLLNKLENNSAELNIQYDYIRNVSESLEDVIIPYHFENFTHFSSATERLRNFHYKIKLIETYDKEISEINLITGPTSASFTTVKAKEDINKKKENLIKGFDGYEHFLYYESSSYSWPKDIVNAPEGFLLGSDNVILAHTTSSKVKNWLGDERSSFANYGGQLLSASLFDRQNDYNLLKLVPTHILDNLQNELYVSFVNMIGQHFDNVWTYVKAITDIHDADNNRGISKNLVYYQLKSLGLEAFDQFENSNLVEYILGEGTGSGYYDTDNLNETMITASNHGSIPKQDISKEIWKRLYHNAPYLLKTKGTERGLRALMSCYGVPSTILNVKEYGGSTPISGPLKDLDTADTYKTFTYEKASLALKGNSGTNGFFIKTNWSSSLNSNQDTKKTIEFRIKPAKTDANYLLLALSGSTNSVGTQFPDRDNILILEPYLGSDISSSGDHDQYGRLSLYQGSTIRTSTNYFPVFNGDFWNIHLSIKDITQSPTTASFGAYQANWLKNVSYYVTESHNITTPKRTWGHNQQGAKHVYFGGVPLNSFAQYNNHDGLIYSGSLQEVRYYFGEELSHSTHKKHALEPFMYAGNSLSSSYDNLVLRLPLGSNDQADSSSFHPNIDLNPFLAAPGVGIGFGIIGTSGSFIVGNFSASATVGSNMDSQVWEEVVEPHYLPTPDTVGISMTSEKVRIDEGNINGNVLSPFVRLETSTLDRQPQDFEDLGVYFSPTTEINEDIIYTLGSFRLDDYIGSPLPSNQTSSTYSNLKIAKDLYFKKVKRNRYKYGDYIKQIQYIDHTLFKMIEQFVPFKSNLKTGLLIEPHYLERTKFARELPIIDDGQTMVTGSYQTFEVEIKSKDIYNVNSGSKAFGVANNVREQWDPGTYVTYTSNLSPLSSSKGKRIEQGTNTTIEIFDDYLDSSGKDPNRENNQASQAPIKPFVTSKPLNYIAHQSSVLLGNVMGGKKSNKYYKYTEYRLQTSSLY